ncbi:glycoside hydrolase family 26 protein [Maribacter sp. 2-571]|uniref:glycoside hydrolase family 26 protein n=1 Tax=Maribacter sp. 2-571 TaxID=3417569 RepID=UPI003D331065
MTDAKKIATTTIRKKMTRRTAELLRRLSEIPKKGYAFGHQDALSYGITWKNNGKKMKSDVALVCGKYPAVFGFELGNLEKALPNSIDSVNFDIMRKLIRKAYKKGGVVTLSWHPDNPVSNGNAWDITKAVPSLLPEGDRYDTLYEWTKNLAHFFRSLKDKKGKRIPVIFRPYHEMNGGWFWWGKGHCNAQEYQRLWRETHRLLVREFKVHNLLYCYSPNLLFRKKDYLTYYPGDAYVDMLGIDVYQHLTTGLFKRHLKKDLRTLQTVAKAKNKPYALTETGLEKVNTANWFTKVLHPLLKDSGICYALVWRNDSERHHYAPFPGHTSCDDFIRFSRLEEVLFLNDLKR